MTYKQIKNLLLVCPPTRNDRGDFRLRKALRAVERKPELQALLKNQAQFDAHVAKGLYAISLPDSLTMNVSNMDSVLSRRTSPMDSIRDPAMLSVAIAAFLLVGLSIGIFLGKISSFPGSAEAWQVVSSGNSLDQLEPVALKGDALDDWFAMKGMDQFWAPPGLSKLGVADARVFTFSDVSVAMGAVPKFNMFFYVFNGMRLGIRPAEGKWKILKRDRKALAVTGHGDLVFMIETEAGRRELHRILQNLSPLGE